MKKQTNPKQLVILFDYLSNEMSRNVHMHLLILCNKSK